MALITILYLLFISVLMYLIIWTNLNPVIKAALICAGVWYCILVYSIPSNFAGKPILKDTLPDNSIIISYRIVEPTLQDSGGMFFWLLEKKQYEKKLSLKIHPMLILNEINKICPMSYEIPYNRTLHEQIEAAKAEGRGKAGILTWKKNKGRSGEAQGGNLVENAPDIPGKFEIINPITLLPQKEAGPN